MGRREVAWALIAGFLVVTVIAAIAGSRALPREITVLGLPHPSHPSERGGQERADTGVILDDEDGQGLPETHRVTSSADWSSCAG